MEKVSVEQVQQAVADKNIKLWVLRRCSLCGTALTYAFENGKVTYDPNCSCVSYWNPPEERSWEELAKFFNMQTPENRAKLWADFIASGQAVEV